MHRFFHQLAKGFAQLGGAVLSLLIVMTCLSIAGRLLNSVFHSDFMQSALPALSSAALSWGVGPIEGDFELVEAGMAFTIFAFLPLCQMHGAHASVDIFTQKLSSGITRILRMVIEIVFALVLVLIAVQLFQGLMSKFKTGQTTFLLQFPIWWSYALSFTGAFVAALVAVYLAVMRVCEASSARDILPKDIGADH